MASELGVSDGLEAKPSDLTEVEKGIAITDMQQQRSTTAGHPTSLQQLLFQSRPTRSASGSSLLQVPHERYGSTKTSGGTKRSSSWIKLGEILFEEEADVIRNCGALSSAVLGLMKSFSTSDICSLNEQANCLGGMNYPLRSTVSEMGLLEGWSARVDMTSIRRLDYTSRSCSTWVAVGDPVSSTSQLPSPHAQPGMGLESPTITAIDFVRSVNKKVRQMYIRRRLLSTYRAMGQLSKSQMNLTMQHVNNSVQTSTNANQNLSSMRNSSSLSSSIQPSSLVSPLPNAYSHLKMYPIDSEAQPSSQTSSQQSSKAVSSTFDLANLCFKSIERTISLTAKDVERDKGRSLTKYERNIMIFNWLQNVDESNPLELGPP